jgi:hypothetical protein
VATSSIFFNCTSHLIDASSTLTVLLMAFLLYMLTCDCLIELTVY